MEFTFNMGGAGVETYSKTEIDEKLETLKTELQNFIQTEGYVKGINITTLRSLTSEAYGALPEKDPETIYCIQDAP